MKRKRFSEEQIIGVLKEHEAGAAVPALARRHGVSEYSIYRWKAKFGGLEVSDAKRLRALEAENAKLKRMYSELALENTAIKDVLNDAIRAGGSSLRDHRQTDGELGYFQHRFDVYEQAAEKLSLSAAETKNKFPKHLPIGQWQDCPRKESGKELLRIKLVCGLRR